MSAVIKAQDHAVISDRVRAIAPSRRPAKIEPDIRSELAARDHEIAHLQAALRMMEDEAKRLRADTVEASRESEAKGRDAGLAEAARREADYLAVLEKGVVKAVQDYQKTLDSLERLAPLLAQEGLGMVLGDPKRHADLVADAIRHKLTTIEKQAVIGVLVSKADFPDDVSLTSLRESTDACELNLSASPELGPGECSIRLTLGTLEVGVAQQWDRLARALTAMTEPGPVA
jgi:flagellar assembly protein FliH